MIIFSTFFLYSGSKLFQSFILALRPAGILFNGYLNDFLSSNNKKATPTQIALSEKPVASLHKSSSYFKLENCSKNNLKNINVAFKKESINVVCGVPGSGKTTLLNRNGPPTS